MTNPEYEGMSSPNEAHSGICALIGHCRLVLGHSRVAAERQASPKHMSKANEATAELQREERAI